ncbi:SpaH/EbpB family LPXTG-anchored major pilin [Trueperella pecoris]|uniref:SpaH/EbpB family LPXTG-anchored major pilin n=1 Tax=Trueperella pecoris TaxID=2733571 RepID=A0A7M1QZQ1_9ACTO|nr:SpaH/EbpB family LPXTG-anchored major pilin [Trueperella pecoris]QOR47562.1 SpaH/EbpB family LPXTG-anchored major pilin [Trueperella pecoris]
MKRNKLRAGAAIAAIALLGSMGMGGVAFADTAKAPQSEVSGKDQSAANPALINKEATTQLSIHKYLGTPVEQQKNDGTIQDIKDRTPLENVKFDVYMVNKVNLTTNEGWKAAQNLHECKVSVSDVLQGIIVCKGESFGISEAGSGLTNSFGAAKIDKLPVGLYLVVEDLAGSKDIKGEGKAYKPEQITGINPFLVTLPMTNPDSRDSWMYDVHVYPKNQAAEMTKEVLDGNQGVKDQDGYKIGENITYRLESTINVVDYNQDGKVDGDDLGYYYVKDALSEHVTYVSATLTIVKSNGEEVKLDEDKDYKKSEDKQDGQNVVGFSLTKDGLNKLAEAAGGKLRTEIVTTVSSMPADGQVKNKASFYPNNYPWTSTGQTPPEPGTPPNTPPNTPPDVPSNEVISKYGDILVKKVNAEGTLLDGAEFGVYRAVKNGDDYTCAGVDYKADPIAKTDAPTKDGIAVIKGLQLSNWRNNSVASKGLIEDPKQYYSYCLVETKSPDGYQLLAEPIEFDLTKEGTIADLTKFAQTDPEAGQGLKVINQPDNLKNKLPLTGGQGLALISGLGVVLVGGGAGYYVYSNRRKNA